MKELLVTSRGNVVKAQVDDEDYERLNSFSWTQHGHVKGTHTGVVSRRRMVNSIVTVIPIANEVLEVARMVDHIDGNPLNNQKSNLRICTYSQNNANKPKHMGSASKYKGVTYSDRYSQPWEVRIKSRGKVRFYKRFDTENEAALAYNENAKIIFKEFAYINIIN